MATLRQRFGQTVRDLRLAAGLSQESLADASGLHRTFIGKLERGEETISLDKVERLASALGISLTDLFASVDSLARR